MTDKKVRLRFPELIFIFITAFSTMLICTKSSPLYPLNDWLDANCYMTVGRSMLKGHLPYRDLFEHKGPLIYILHSAAAIISEDSFLGMFVFETAACFWFLTLSFRLICRLSGHSALWTVPVIAVTVYSSGAFCHGDSAEELCLPLILSALSTGLTTSIEKRSMSSKEAFSFGITAGLVLWTKFNLLGAFAGVFIVTAVKQIRRKDIKELIKMSGYSIAGAVAVSLPVILFFAANGAAESLFEVYFYDNLFVYSDSSSPVWINIVDGYIFLITFLPAGFAFIYLGTAAALFRKKWELLAMSGIPAIMSFLLIFAGHLSYQYYPLALAAFVPSGLGICLSMISPGREKIPAAVPAAAALVLCAPLCFLLSPNTYLMKYDRSEMPQYKFADIINETEEPSILNYGFLDGGFYLASDNIPEYRYFCQNNTGLDEMTASQNKYVLSGEPDYIVTRSYSGKKESFPLYTCIAEADFPYYKRLPTYYLYKRNDLIQKQS